MTQLQQTGHVVPTYRTKAHFADSHRYDFWTDNVHFLVEHHQIDTIIIAASMAYEAADPAVSSPPSSNRQSDSSEGVSNAE